MLESLAPQVEGTSREAVLVSTGGEHLADVETRWPWLRVIEFADRMFPGPARNLAAASARGDRLAFLDADAVPAADWVERLEAALQPGADMVVGAVENGTPESSWGTSEYILEFLDWSPRRQGAHDHAVSCNLLVRRSAFEAAGGFPEDIWPGEDTVLSHPFALRGTLAFAPEARVVHLNRTGRRAVLAHQRELGASWVTVCRRLPMPGGWLARPWLAPLTGAGRLLALARGMRRDGIPRGLLPRLPHVLAANCAWSFGVLTAPWRQPEPVSDPPLA